MVRFLLVVALWWRALPRVCVRAHTRCCVVGCFADCPLGRNEVEVLVCGVPHIDIALLKKHSAYRNGLDAGHPLVRAFWAALESYTQDERRLFLRWVRTVLSPLRADAGQGL
jgi:hypothetical protein